MAEVMRPIKKLKDAVLNYASKEDEQTDMGHKFNFHLDPYFMYNSNETHYATFEEYDIILDPYMNLVDRKYLWYMY